MSSLLSSLTTWLTTAGNQRRFYGAVRHFTPVLVVSKRVWVTRYDQVVEVLSRDQDFTIEQINAEKTAQMRVPFSTTWE